MPFLSHLKIISQASPLVWQLQGLFELSQLCSKARGVDCNASMPMSGAEIQHDGQHISQCNQQA